MTLVEFKCRGHRFGLPLNSVRHVLPSVRPALLPGAPAIALGLVNLGGEVIAVVDFYRRIGLPSVAINISQRLLIVDLPGLAVGLLVDEVLGVSDRKLEDAYSVPDKLAGSQIVQTVIRLDDGLSVIINPEKFLFEDEKAQIRDTLKAARDA